MRELFDVLDHAVELPLSLEYLEGYLARLERMPVLILATYRAHFKPQWVGQPLVTTITLSRLGSEQTRSITTRVAGGNRLPDEIVEQIVAKTDGIPLFVEEITKAILESGLLRQTDRGYEACGPLSAMSIPTTLRDSLMARLDRLALIKEVAQIAACIGREFHQQLLALVSQFLPHQLEHALDALVASELVFKRGQTSEAVYTFKHALIQETAYESLLKAKRQDLHGRIARVLKEHFPDISETEPELLAHHYTEAGMNSEAVEYWRKAGELALQRLAFKEAIAHLSTGLRLVETLPASADRDGKELDLRTPLGTAWLGLRGWAAPEIWNSLHPALALAESLGRKDAFLPILSGLSVNLHNRGRIVEALQWIQRMLETADAIGEMGLRISAHAQAVVSYFWLGRFATAREHGDKLLACILEAERDGTTKIWSASTPATSKTSLGCCASQWIWMLGYPDEAVRICEEKDRFARADGNPWNIAYALGGLGSWLFEYRGEPGVLMDRADECERVGRDNSLSFFYEVQAPRTRAVALIRSGQLAQGIAELSKYTEPPMTTLDMRPYLVTLLAEAKAAAGDLDAALHLVRGAIEQVEQSDWEGHAHYAESLRVEGWILQQMGQHDEARGRYLAAIDFARRQQAKSWELRASISLGRLLAERGERRQARELVASIYGWFTEGFGTKDLKEAKALLVHLTDA